MAWIDEVGPPGVACSPSPTAVLTISEVAAWAGGQRAQSFLVSSTVAIASLPPSIL
jgi:hypothetical protein